jgi:hypothetical protein
VCPQDRAFAASVASYPESFSARLILGPLPDWLELVSVSPTLRVYRIRP